MLDANANRAREGLRVIEDYARFVLNDAGLQTDLKSLRHDLTTALKPFLPDAILHRDTPGDVGTTAAIASEYRRADFEDVVVAAGKRLGEALRAIEEVLKTFPRNTGVSPVSNSLGTGGTPVLREADAPETVESIRYRFYAIEQRIALTLRPAKPFANVRLYVLITERLCSRPWLEAADLAIAGGADCIQLREKELESGELLCRAKQLVVLCKTKQALCIINDRPDIALLAGADGVHVGQGDLPCREVRRLLGANKIVGVSTHEIAHARQAVRDGADYVGVGPVFRSGTKPRDILPGLDYARQAAAELPIPTVAIAGITAANAAEVVATGVQAIAVTAAVVGASDIRAAARQLKESFATDGAPMNTDAKRR
jgi:thiamine-phosphate pyrophosphorylase